MRKKFHLLLFFLVAFSAGMIAQETEVNGRVVDESGIPLPGVNVIEKGTSNGVVTDFEGEFSINVSDASTLQFSYVGFETMEIPVDGRTSFNVTMRSSASALQEVIVFGYGKTNKSTFTGSAVTLSSEDLNVAPLSVANMLQGKASGVQIIQNNATPGAALSIRIRGTNSLNANSEPLYVIDGFPMADEVGFSVNPDDIESISILKDASSTAIYGARGANGVVLITTKSGSSGKSSLNVHSNYGMQQVVDKFDMVDPFNHALRLNALLEKQGNLPPYGAERLMLLEEGQIGTDWQDEAFRIASIQNHTVSLSGGTEKTSVFSSINYMDQEGVIINTGYNRIGGRVNVEHSINDRLKMSARIFSNYAKQEELPLTPSTINGFLKQVLRANPASQFDSNVELQRDAQNPLHFMAAQDRENSFLKLQGYFSLQYEIIDDLIFKTDLGGDLNRNKYLHFSPSTIPLSSATNGSASILNIEQDDVLINPTLTYSFTKGDHNSNLLLGYNFQEMSYWESGTYASDFASDDLGYNNIGVAQQFTAYSGKAVNTRKSWFGRISYDYLGRYIFSGTFRVDGSSVFGANHKLGYFPSAAVAWKFDQEDFMEPIDFLSSGKLRASYGTTGNDRISGGNSLAIFGANNSTKYTFDGHTTVNGIAVMQLSTPDLKWEETSSVDFGIELGFFGGRLILESDYYVKKTTDLLLSRNVSPATGFVTRLGNQGEVHNRGFELFLQSVNLSANHPVQWTSSFNFAKNDNEVIALGANNVDIYVGQFKPDGSANFENPHIITVGESIGSLYGYVYDGIIQENDPVLTTTHPNASPGDPKFVDTNNDGILDPDDRQILGVGIPDITFGFTNEVTYKNFNLNVVLLGQAGGKLLNTQKTDLQNPFSQGNVIREVLTETWSEENTDGTIPARGWYGNSHGSWVNSRFVESSDYVRIKNITLSYNLPNNTLAGIGINSGSIYINAQNLYTFTNYSGLDPEVGNLVEGGPQERNRNVARGIDFNAYPVSRMLVGGIKLSF